jgi:hypothetical protein
MFRNPNLLKFGVLCVDNIYVIERRALQPTVAGDKVAVTVFLVGYTDDTKQYRVSSTSFGLGLLDNDPTTLNPTTYEQELIALYHNKEEATPQKEIDGTLFSDFAIIEQ